jgi:hypothetical protein
MKYLNFPLKYIIFFTWAYTNSKPKIRIVYIRIWERQRGCWCKLVCKYHCITRYSIPLVIYHLRVSRIRIVHFNCKDLTYLVNIKRYKYQSIPSSCHVRKPNCVTSGRHFSNNLHILVLISCHGLNYNIITIRLIIITKEALL